MNGLLATVRLYVDQLAGIRVGGTRKNLLCRSGLDDLTVFHHVDASRERTDDAEIVRDKHDGHAELPLQVVQELQQMRLGGDIQRAGRLIRDQ